MTLKFDQKLYQIELEKVMKCYSSISNTGITIWKTLDGRAKFAPR